MSPGEKGFCPHCGAQIICGNYNGQRVLLEVRPVGTTFDLRENGYLSSRTQGSEKRHEEHRCS